MSRYIPDEVPDTIREILVDKVSPLVSEIIASTPSFISDEDVAFLDEHVGLWVGERRIRSALLGEYIKPCNAYPDGVVLLHVDAIMTCSQAIGVPFDTMLASTLIHEISHWYTMRREGMEHVISEHDEEIAEDVADEVCKDLYDHKVISGPMKSIRSDHSTAMSFLLWLREWTGMTPEEWEKAMEELYD